jgi:hypothetical protein
VSTDKEAHPTYTQVIIKLKNTILKLSTPGSPILPIISPFTLNKTTLKIKLSLCLTNYAIPHEDVWGEWI